jgi:hypothetical protein
VAFLSLRLANKNSPAEVTDGGVLSIHDFTDLGGGSIPMANMKQSATVRMRPSQDSSVPHTLIGSSQTMSLPARGQRFRFDPVDFQ